MGRKPFERTASQSSRRAGGGGGRGGRSVARVGLVLIVRRLQDLRLPTLQGRHEVEVGGNGRVLLVQQVEGPIQRTPLLEDQVREAHGHRARDAGQAVDEDGGIVRARLLDERDGG